MKVVVIIPARYNSTRLKGKPLIEIKGISMIKRVYLQARLILSVDDIYIATDDERIEKEVLTFTRNCIMTSSNCKSGTDRCLEAYSKLDKEYDLLVNIQGDEPFIEPIMVENLIQEAKNTNYNIYTLYKKESLDIRSYKNPNVVKVTFNKLREALYFSRLSIPYNGLTDFNKHIGIYAFKSPVIPLLNKLEKSYLEKCENLEQLKWLDNGLKIKMVKSMYNSISIDTQEDLEKISK
jgi:3-deoxy-manno-octulosonate cytidylyltransferase (CMP-KDO synthetase)